MTPKKVVPLEINLFIHSSIQSFVRTFHRYSSWRWWHNAPAGSNAGGTMPQGGEAAGAVSAVVVGEYLGHTTAWVSGGICLCLGQVRLSVV